MKYLSAGRIVNLCNIIHNSLCKVNNFYKLNCFVFYAKKDVNLKDQILSACLPGESLNQFILTAVYDRINYISDNIIEASK